MSRTALRPTVIIPLLFAVGACGGETNGPDQTLRIFELASQVNVLAGGDPLSDDTQKSIADLSADISRVMASKAFPSPPHHEGLLAQPASVPWDITGMLLGSNAADTDTDLAAAASPSGTILSAAAIGPRVLGVTCVWDVAGDFWKGSPDIYGPVPADLTRFELYKTQKTGPLVPLQKLNTFVDVRPRVQASDPTLPGNVNLLVEARSTSNVILSMLLAGQSNPNTNVLDLLMSGGVRSGGGNVLDYLFTINNSRATNVMTVDDLLIFATVRISGGARGNLLLQKRNDPRQSVEYDFVLSGTNTIATGSAWVGATRVASISGSRLTPTFTAQSNRFTEMDNLQLIYTNLLKLDTRINDMFFFAHCVGTDEPGPCQMMIQRLLN